MFVEEFSDSKPYKRTRVAPTSRQANTAVLFMWVSCGCCPLKRVTQRCFHIVTVCSMQFGRLFSSVVIVCDHNPLIAIVVEIKILNALPFTLQ